MIISNFINENDNPIKIKIKIKKILQQITKQKKNLLTQALAYLFKDRIQKVKI